MTVARKGQSGFTGKISNKVVYLLNGQWVERSIGKNNKPPTVLQLACRERTVISNRLLSPVKDFINVGFKARALAERKNAHNIASSYNRMNAITGDYPGQQINYRKVLFSDGHIPIPTGVVAKLAPLGVEFSWHVDEDTKSIRWNDQAMLMVYKPEENDAVFSVNGARRKEGKDLLRLPSYNEAVVLETYISFISANHQSVSSSIYTGRFLWGGNQFKIGN